MSILLLLVPVSVVLLGSAIWAFAWAVRNGQFEDLDSAALDILVDEVAVAGRRDAREMADPGGVDGGAPRGPACAHRAPRPGGRGEEPGVRSAG